MSMSSPLWMSVEPLEREVRLMLCEPLTGPVLKARLRTPPAHRRALVLLLEALSAWYRSPLHAVVDVDGPGIRSEPERWVDLLGDAPGLDVRVEWVARPVLRRRRDRFLGSLGEFTASRRLLRHATTGQP